MRTYAFDSAQCRPYGTRCLSLQLTRGLRPGLMCRPFGAGVVVGARSRRCSRRRLPFCRSSGAARRRPASTKARNICVACELRSPATAFGRAVSFFFSSRNAALHGRSSTVAPAPMAVSTTVPLAGSVEELGFSPASGAELSRALAPVPTKGMRGSSRRRLAVVRVVEDGVDVMEDVLLGDGGVGVVGTELIEGPVGRG